MLSTASILLAACLSLATPAFASSGSDSNWYVDPGSVAQTSYRFDCVGIEGEVPRAWYVIPGDGIAGLEDRFRVTGENAAKVVQRAPTTLLAAFSERPKPGRIPIADESFIIGYEADSGSPRKYVREGTLELVRRLRDEDFKDVRRMPALPTRFAGREFFEGRVSARSPARTRGISMRFLAARRDPGPLLVIVMSAPSAQEVSMLRASLGRSLKVGSASEAGCRSSLQLEWPSGFFNGLAHGVLTPTLSVFSLVIWPFRGDDLPRGNTPLGIWRQLFGYLETGTWSFRVGVLVVFVAVIGFLGLGVSVQSNPGS